MEEEKKVLQLGSEPGQVYRLLLRGRGQPGAGKRLDVAMPAGAPEVEVIQGSARYFEFVAEEFRRCPDVFEQEAARSIEEALRELRAMEAEDRPPPIARDRLQDLCETLRSTRTQTFQQLSEDDADALLTKFEQGDFSIAQFAAAMNAAVEQRADPERFARAVLAAAALLNGRKG